MSQPKTDLILKFLSQEGFRPTVDEEGDIRFQFEGQTLFIHPEEADPQLLKLFGFAWRFDSEPEEEDEDPELVLALQVAGICSAKHNGIKAIAIPERVIVVVAEQFYEPFETFKGTFFRLLDAEATAPGQIRQWMQADGIHPNKDGVARVVASLGPTLLQQAIHPLKVCLCYPHLTLSTAAE